MTNSRHHMKPTGIQNLLSDALSRHGIGKQVTSAMIIKMADEFLNQNLPIHAKDDIKTLSFKDGDLNIACRHPAAIFVAEDMKTGLQNHLQQAFPQVTFTAVYCRLNTQPWQIFE